MSCVCLQLVQLESELNTERESLHSAEHLGTDLMKEKALLEKTLETLRENSERQVHTHTHMVGRGTEFVLIWSGFKSLQMTLLPMYPDRVFLGDSSLGACILPTSWRPLCGLGDKADRV